MILINTIGDTNARTEKVLNDFRQNKIKRTHTLCWGKKGHFL